MFIYIYIFVLL